MGYDHDIFIDPVPTRLVCPYCQQVYRRPKKGSCDHILCLECWLVDDRTVSCPICPIEPEKKSKFYLSKNHPYENEIGKLLTGCEVFSCSETIALFEREDHISNCSNLTAYKKGRIPIHGSKRDDIKVGSRTNKRFKPIKKLLIKYTAALCVTGIFTAFNMSGSEQSDLSEADRATQKSEGSSNIVINSIGGFLDPQQYSEEWGST
jgi:hypothetical protein